MRNQAGAPVSPQDQTQLAVSPSLRAYAPHARVTAYETKFLLTEDVARALESRLLASLLPDPHADPSLGGMYATTSMTCDAPGFPVFFRDPSVKSRKYRVRRYGDAETIYLERKRSRQGKVSKRRVDATAQGLAALSQGEADNPALTWFLRETQALDLAPVCRMRYLRRALFGVMPDGPVRVTFDRSIRGSLAQGWSLDQQGEERAILDGLVICEFKYERAMPAMLKSLVRDFALEPTGVSKYRACARAFARELGIDLTGLPPVHHVPKGKRPGAAHGSTHA